jgi:hypothetical protein
MGGNHAFRGLVHDRGPLRLALAILICVGRRLMIGAGGPLHHGRRPHWRIGGRIGGRIGWTTGLGPCRARYGAQGPSDSQRRDQFVLHVHCRPL